MKKLLVANRSEIACRVFQSCNELGIKTVAVYAPGDEDARHVTFADEAIHIQNYLDPKEIISAVKKSGAQLVHPGYGFLSERAHFVKALEAEKIGFVGPRAETMEILGEKIQAKKIAEKSKVPTLPWAEVKTSGDLKKEAKRIGFPLLLKAAAGGGGKGMRVVKTEGELEAAQEGAAQEALAAFGDGTLFLEKFIENPRHIEVQIFGDGKGSGIHLFERECSLQRRHQKVWEEAQAPHLSEKTKNLMYEAAIRLISETQYLNAGTVEFILDEDESFYFLEVNTRLQVEHPVTEEVTGVDLVRSQLLLALGSKELKLFQSPPTASKHAIEVRIYAENPYQGFIPSSGSILDLHWPTGVGIRVESGIECGQKVHTQFDAMLAKLIVVGENRKHALARLDFALSQTSILGVTTNLLFLKNILQAPEVQEGKVTTRFIEKWLAKNKTPLPSCPSEVLLKLLEHARTSSAGSLGGSVGLKNQEPLSPFYFFNKKEQQS